MANLTINGRAMEVPGSSTILQACRAARIELPTLCHDERIHPIGACRLCLVQVHGISNLVPACCTHVADGMEVETHTTAIEDTRRTILQLLAQKYPSEAAASSSEKPFQRWLAHYHVEPGERDGGAAESRNPGLLTHSSARFRDSSHPYLHVDMSRCITCFRCVRICKEVQGHSVWHAHGRGADTWIAPDGRTMLESSCVSCGACADTCPTGAIEDQSVLEFGPAVKWTRTVCPYCGTGCEMNVGMRNSHIVQVQPVLDAAVNKGHLCVKGRYAFDFVRAADRITEPMIRRDGKWETVSWSEAIQFIGANLTEILEESGADSIGVLGSARATNEENYLTQKFARVVLGTNNVDCCARVCHAPTAAGLKRVLGTGAATNSFDDIERAATFLVCGCNPTENHPIVGGRINQAVLRGARLIVIDPRKIDLARHATIHLQLRPGTNVPLLNALACVIVRENLVDETALRERVSDFDAFRDFITAQSVERAAAICGVKPALIREAARLYATHKPSMCFHGLGITEHVQGTDSVMCLANLALLTGNFGQPGSGVNPLRGQNNVQGSAHMGCEPANLTGFVSIDEGREMFESVWNAPLPHARGLNLMQMLDAASAGRLRALWAIGYDIALTNPNARATREALRKMDLIIAQDLFMNELARDFAHVILPACSSFEKDGTFMNSDRRVQRVRQVIDTLGNSKPDWQIICTLAKSMGFGDEFDFHSPEEIWNEIRSVWKAGAGITYARLDHGGLQWPCPTEDHPGTPILHTKTFPHGARAPLQRVEFHPTLEVTTEEYPFLLTTGRTLYQFNAGTMTMRTPNAQLREKDTLDIAPADAARLGLNHGDRACVRSRQGEVQMFVNIDGRIKQGELFATFHTADVFLNNLTNGNRDGVTMTPEYKVVAVNVAKV